MGLCYCRIRIAPLSMANVFAASIFILLDWSVTIVHQTSIMALPSLPPSLPSHHDPSTLALPAWPRILASGTLLLIFLPTGPYFLHSTLFALFLVYHPPFAALTRARKPSPQCMCALERASRTSLRAEKTLLRQTGLVSLASKGSRALSPSLL